MKKGFTIAQLVGFLTLFFMFLILLFIGIKLFKSVTSEKEILQNTDVKNEKIKININYSCFNKSIRKSYINQIIMFNIFNRF